MGRAKVTLKDWAPGVITTQIENKAMNGLEKACEQIADRARGMVPVDSGLLKSSIRVRRLKGDPYLDVRVYAGYRVQGGGGPFYACILGSETTIRTPSGSRYIAAIKEGDMVMGQDGLPHRVIAKTSFPAIEKPNLTRITVQYRSDRNHVLTVTDDHKILTVQKGVTFWVKASDLEIGSEVFVPQKIAHNKGAGGTRICQNCGRAFARYESTGQKYCSWDCRDEYWRKVANPHVGMKRSEKSRSLMSAVTSERMKKRPETHPNRIMAKRGYTTDTEAQVEKWIRGTGLPYQRQYKVGRHFADFAIPEKKMLIEADGAFWHSDQSRDIERDKEVMSILPDWYLLHLHFTDRRFSKIVDPSPMPGVYYLQCNDSMNSFVNASYFKAATIIKKESLVCTNRQSRLYDLAVEDVHSFIANGIIVSNSMIEFGTKKLSKRPFLRPALDSVKGNVISIIEGG